MDVKDVVNGLLKEEIKKCFDIELKKQGLKPQQIVSAYIKSPAFKKELKELIEEQSEEWFSNLDLFECIPSSVYKRITENAIKGIFK